jgi:hypothetical protein
MYGMAANDISELEDLVYNSINAGQRVMQFKLLNVDVDDNDALCDEILESVSEQCERLLNDFSIDMRYNEALWVFEIEIS